MALNKVSTTVKTYAEWCGLTLASLSP